MQFHLNWMGSNRSILGHPIAWMLFLIMFIWQIPHFLALAMKRVDEYRNAGIPMLPVVHGFEITKRQIMIWTVCLLPLPFYMSGLGITFMVIATLLNIGWIVLGFYGFRKKDDIKWSVQMFVYSLNYLTTLFVSMIVVTFFVSLTTDGLIFTLRFTLLNHTVQSNSQGKWGCLYEETVATAFVRFTAGFTVRGMQ